MVHSFKKKTIHKVVTTNNNYDQYFIIFLISLKVQTVIITYVSYLELIHKLSSIFFLLELISNQGGFQILHLL